MMLLVKVKYPSEQKTALRSDLRHFQFNENYFMFFNRCQRFVFQIFVVFEETSFSYALFKANTF